MARWFHGLFSAKEIGATSSKALLSVDPNAYTSGRWLHHDKVERDARHINFDFGALMETAVNACAGAKNVVHCEKVEGGFNKVFIITMDNDAKLVAKLPTRIAGPSRLVTLSEVATMSYLRTLTDIPVPRVLSWSHTAANRVGAEYIIMDHMAGVPLLQVWQHMRGEQHIQFIRNFGKLMSKMGSLAFPAYGSLYFSDTSLVSEPVSRIDLRNGFCIGPHCGTNFWDCSVSEAKYYHFAKPNRGPWKDFDEYTAALIDAGYARIPEAEDPSNDRLPYQGSIQENLELLETSRKILEEYLVNFAPIKEASAPALWHPDLHMRNIYVSKEDPAVIEGLIDWQATSIEPAFTYAFDTPDFAETLPHDPDLDRQLDEHKTKDQERLELDRSLCNQAFEVCMHVTPKLGKARALEPTLIRPFLYCHTGWRNSAAMLRSELMDLADQWQELGLPGECPYAPSEEERALQKKHYEDFEVVQRLKSFLERRFYGSSDGWVPTDKWEVAKETHSALYQDWLRSAMTAGDEGMTQEKAEKMWPWNGR